jgi:hypothetical protein
MPSGPVSTALTSLKSRLSIVISYVKVLFYVWAQLQLMCPPGMICGYLTYAPCLTIIVINYVLQRLITNVPGNCGPYYRLMVLQWSISKCAALWKDREATTAPTTAT